MIRKIIQIEQSVGAKGEPYVLALCDDGTVWAGQDKTGIMRWKYISISELVLADKTIQELEIAARDAHATALVKEVENNSLSDLVTAARHPEAAE